MINPIGMIVSAVFNDPITGNIVKKSKLKIDDIGNLIKEYFLIYVEEK